MSGIIGIYNLNHKPVESADLGQMVDILVHRGPDGADIWSQGSIGLGHRMLWTTPESMLEKLPLVREGDKLAITADARIDNRDELISLLSLDHQPAEKITDSQIILAAYAKWGESCPYRLIGDFAFAIWDGRKQQLFCARDPMGVKPFYYYHSPEIFVFASEIKALLCLREVPKRLNELKVGYYLEMFCEDQVMTFYQDIFRLPAASYVSLGGDNQIQVKSYWSLDPKREIRLNSDQEYIEAFGEVFTQAVQCRLRSAFPVGSALSGGLDSSSIACTARQLLAKAGNQQLHTFSAIFPSLPQEELRWIDERRYINAVKALGGFISHDIRADQLHPLIDILWQDEEPIPAPNLYIHQGLYECANQQGVRVFLDGIDGDSTISHGWSYLTELAYRGRWHTLFQEVTTTARRCNLSRRSIVQENVLNPLLLEPLSYFWQTIRKITGKNRDYSNIINQSFAEKIELVEHSETLLNNIPGLVFSARQQHWLGLTSGMYPYVMEIADKASARCSLEARYPFFDRRLMEFCLALPPEQKFRQGWTRAILRFAMEDILPPKVQWRVSKGRLNYNFDRKLLEVEHKTLEEVINKPQAIESYVNIPVLRSAYERYRSQPQEIGDEPMKLLLTTSLALWLDNSNLTI
ncbi:MAG: lasso peptide isopeptide bond-forming cyclase [Nostocaceae cyanobacterium]|nr:lasso peptide isopeptide bond-forming cyclase [Nostocaceae cyanobacterium]